MCLGVPGKILKKWHDSQTNLLMAEVDFDGMKKQICLDYNPEAEVGDVVLVHVGFSLGKVTLNP